MKKASKVKENPAHIKVLMPNDVLLGRGLGASKFEGNERFRDEIIEPRKATYNTTISYKQKGVIAQDCYDEAKQRGARFLKLVKTTGRLARNVVETGTWIEVSKREALEKCKQSLREKFVAKSTQMHKRQGRFKLMSIKPPSSDTKNDSESLPTCTQSNNEGRPSGTSAVIDSPTKASDRSGSTSLGPGGASRESLKVVIKAPSSAGPSLNKGTPIADDEREAALALAGLATSLAKHPKLPKEQDEMAAQQTATNRRSVATAHQRKRARNDMDKETLSFLVGQMRFQIETIPPENKQVFHEAQVRCRHNGGAEFSDERLECFLRVGGMNPTIAAQRFIEYWNARREVFGNNFTRRLTLSEALKDDIPALRASVIRVLPHKDVYGRQLVLLEPRRNTGGYTPESLLRAMWYTAEVLSQETTDIHNGFIFICWMKDSVVGGYDFGTELFGQITYYETHYWPVRFISAHIFHASKAFPQVDSRVLIHNVGERDILGVLCRYGIYKNMLPTFMQGTIDVSAVDWIAQRRAVEAGESEMQNSR